VRAVRGTWGRSRGCERQSRPGSSEHGPAQPPPKETHTAQGAAESRARHVAGHGPCLQDSTHARGAVHSHRMHARAHAHSHGHCASYAHARCSGSTLPHTRARDARTHTRTHAAHKRALTCWMSFCLWVLVSAASSLTTRLTPTSSSSWPPRASSSSVDAMRDGGRVPLTRRRA